MLCGSTHNRALPFSMPEVFMQWRYFTTLHLSRMPVCRKTSLPGERKELSDGDRRVAILAWNRLLMIVLGNKIAGATHI